jgi:hypothetical protein
LFLLVDTQAFPYVALPANSAFQLLPVHMIADLALQHRCNRGTRLFPQWHTSRANYATQSLPVRQCDGTCEQPMFMR